jgi:phenylalanine-4-hydroxylase
MKPHVYKSKIPNKHGFVEYTEEENQVWKKLYERQIKLLQGRACAEFIEGISNLGINADAIPQLPELSARLKSLTGWSVTPVKALISFKEFFELLAKKQFPAATFIRIAEHLDYLKEPDIFHEIFGHCPLLTHPAFAEFTKRVGEIGLSMSKEERVMLARLYWFTVEFGLIKANEGLRIYGGGILSSIGESIYSLESDIPLRRPFDLLTVLRTPYRYDEMQKNYFVINSFEELFNLVSVDLKEIFKKAMEHGVITEEESDVRSC